VNPRPGQIDSWKRIYRHIPIMSLAELRTLPEPQEFDSGVYFLWEGEQLQYIGKSRDILGRSYYQTLVNRNFEYHVSTTAKRIPFDRITCWVIERGPIACPCLAGNLEAYERAYLAHYETPYNFDCQNGFS
jgi:hypothetical protein